MYPYEYNKYLCSYPYEYALFLSLSFDGHVSEPCVLTITDKLLFLNEENLKWEESAIMQ